MQRSVDALEVDWSEETSRRRNRSTVLAAAGTLAIASAFAYDYLAVGGGTPLFGYEVSRLDWLWLVSLWLFVVYVVVPAVANPRATAAVLGRVRDRPGALVAGAFSTGVFLAGVVGPLVVSQPTPDFLARNQPPVFTSVSRDLVVNCLHPVGDRCFGTWRHPLGTTTSGKDVLRVLVLGARIVVELSMVAVVLIVPLATAVGTIGAYLGGRIDRVLTGLSETVKTIPALLVFLVWRWVSGEGTAFMLALSFGLFSWGTVAAVVRSRALTEVTKNYVTAAEASGASTAEIIRWHLVPNVARSAVSTTLYQIPVFVTVEATLSFLRWGVPSSPLLMTTTGYESWGSMIGDNVGVFDQYWWRVALPMAAFFLTILSLSAFANAVQAVLDPHSNS